MKKIILSIFTLLFANLAIAQTVVPPYGVSSGITPILGGTDKRVLFDDNGVIGEDAGLTYDKTLGVLAIGGKTVTTSNPPLSVTQTWNAGAVVFTGIKFNVTDTASSGSSQIMDLQVGGATKFSVSKLGTIATVTGVSAYGNGNSSGFSALTDTGPAFRLGASSDVILTRDAANTLALRNGSSAQMFNVYATYTDASNYAYLRSGFDGSNFILQGGRAGTGPGYSLNIGLDATSSGNINFATLGANKWQIQSAGNIIAGTDNTYDIGASGASRPRNVYIGTSIVTGSTTLHTTSVALTNGAAAAAGTLLNAPVAGNPTKWIPINDNGTTRYIPAW
jgi:hypothetical protein